MAVDDALDFTRRGAVDVDADKNILPWEHQGPADRCRHPRLNSVVIIFFSFLLKGGGLLQSGEFRSFYYECGSTA